jgi:hypothetical protein
MSIALLQPFSDPEEQSVEHPGNEEPEQDLLHDLLVFAIVVVVVVVVVFAILHVEKVVDVLLELRPLVFFFFRPQHGVLLAAGKLQRSLVLIPLPGMFMLRLAPVP